MSLSPAETRASLILRLRNADDVAAWDEFVEIYGPTVFRVARGRGFQAADAEDLVQQVLLAVAQSLDGWLERDDRGPFRAWLLRIARHEAADMLTRRATRSLGQDGDEGARLLSRLPSGDDVAAQLEIEHQRAVLEWAGAQVRGAVAELTWQAFWLTHVEGLSIAEAARRLGTRPGNIYFGRSRVMARIKECVQKYEERHGER
ncbi:MAG: sigma-70 family RNA polymerase sigma factor [Pirellulales bacterium]